MQPENSFEINLQHYDAVNLEINKKKDNLNVKIDPKDAVTKELDEHFICQICCFVVSDPIECNQCEKPFCKECYIEWSIKSPQCPNCRIKNEHRPLSRFALNSLNATSFNCLQCIRPFKYFDHQCIIDKQLCILNCGNLT